LEHSRYKRQIEKLETDSKQLERQVDSLKQENKLLQTANTASDKQQQLDAQRDEFVLNWAEAGAAID